MSSTDKHPHDELTHEIIGAALEVHRHLGPGLMEASYERALCLELSSANIRFVRQITVPVTYKGTVVGEYRADLIVENRVVVEIKSVDRLAGVHVAQLIAYMRVLRVPNGLLLNFYGEVLRAVSSLTSFDLGASEPRCRPTSSTHQRKTRRPLHNGPSRTYLHSGLIVVSRRARSTPSKVAMWSGSHSK